MSTNYSIGTRDIYVAGKLWAKKAYLSSESKYIVGQRWVPFVDFVRTYDRVHKMEEITRQMVISYAIYLLDLNLNGQIARKTMQCRLSAVNVLIRVASRNAKREVHFRRDLGLARAAPKILVDRGARYSESACAKLPPRAFAMSQMQRHFGLRREESAKINVREALLEARNYNQITITAGTKGGKDRVVPLRSKTLQLSVLSAAAEFQGSHKSMIPKELSYGEFKSQIRSTAYRRGVKFHDARHAYAQETYQRLAGWPPPICMKLTKRQHKKFVIKKYRILESVFVKYDCYARLTVAKELGHERIEISRTYLG